MGTITVAAAWKGYTTAASDIVSRGGFLDGAPKRQRDFFSIKERCDNIVTNPPLDLVQEFIGHALGLARGKVVAIFPTARLNAARWLRITPLRRVWLMTPRPSMPPGETILAGKKPGGGKVDYCWLVFDDSWQGGPTAIDWLHRDRHKQ
jgi:hypothetical protein